MPIDIESLERATLDAVAPSQLIEIAGWLVPIDRSTIGRATSAVPVRHEGLQIADIDAIKAIYDAHGLPAKFRMPEALATSPVHAALAQRGYVAEQPTLVQIANSALIAAAGQKADVVVRSTPSADWKSVYVASGFDAQDGLQRANALSRSAFVRYAHIVEQGLTVASGTASHSHSWAGLHGIRTLPQARGRGMATAIIRALLQEVGREGTHDVYLQVEESNANAIRLYEAMGFRTAWRYHYWKKPD